MNNAAANQRWRQTVMDNKFNGMTFSKINELRVDR